MALIESGDYDAGYAILEELGESEDVQSNKYDRAMEALNDGNSGMAYDLLKGLTRIVLPKQARFFHSIRIISLEMPLKIQSYRLANMSRTII